MSVLTSMSKLLASAGALSLLAVAAPTFASTEKDDSERTICKREAQTGTRFPKKICRTRAQWDQMAEQHKREAAEMANRPMIETRRLIRGE